MSSPVGMDKRHLDAGQLIRRIVHGLDQRCL